MRLCGTKRNVENMTSIEILEVNAGKRNEPEAAAIVLLHAAEACHNQEAINILAELRFDLMHNRMKDPGAKQ